MKKLFILLLTLCLITALAACGASADDEIKDVRIVSFEGKELTVTLGTNKSTGYEWDYKINGECIEPSDNRTFKVTATKGDAIGEVSIGFEAITAGSSFIEFTTPNGWDATGEGDAYNVYVQVDLDGEIVSAVGEETVKISKTCVTIDELAEGTYTGSMSGIESTSSNDDAVDVSIYTQILPADITVTIENEQITLYCEATANSYATIQDVKTPQTSDYKRIATGTLPLTRKDDDVIAEGKVSAKGSTATVHYTDGVFDSWELSELEDDASYTCSVHIAMQNNVPVATITLGKTNQRTATVPLMLKTDLR